MSLKTLIIAYAKTVDTFTSADVVSNMPRCYGVQSIRCTLSVLKNEKRIINVDSVSSNGRPYVMRINRTAGV